MENKFKICPECQKKNHPELKLCWNCQYTFTPLSEMETLELLKKRERERQFNRILLPVCILVGAIPLLMFGVCCYQVLKAN